MKKLLIALSASLILGAGSAFAEDQVPPSASYMDSVIRAEEGAPDFRQAPPPRVRADERQANFDRGEAPGDFRRPPAPDRHHPAFRHHRRDRDDWKDCHGYRHHEDRDDEHCDGPRRHRDWHHDED